MLPPLTFQGARYCAMRYVAIASGQHKPGGEEQPGRAECSLHVKLDACPGNLVAPIGLPTAACGGKASAPATGSCSPGGLAAPIAKETDVTAPGQSSYRLARCGPGRGHPMAGFANLIWLDLECADPPLLAEFYHQVLGWDVAQANDDYAVLSDGSTRIRVGGVDGYRAPGWPDSAAPKRYHLDLRVHDVRNAVERCRELGASKPDFQPGGDRWTVLTDPAGHPFCLCPAQAG